jgi:Transcriptional regulator/sugar kinase
MIALGIDIGGTYVKFFAVNEKGKVLKSDKMPTYKTLDAEGFLTQLADIINSWKKIFKIKDRKDFIVGVGTAGDTDNEKGILRFAPNLPWRNLKLMEGLKRKTGCKCFVSNDANMAAWGVYAKELKKKYKNIIVITLGTGIGGGIIVGGKLLQGATGSAGELGHVCIDFSENAPLCGCGQRGCLEAFAGTKGILRMAQAAAVKNPDCVLASLLKKNDFSVKLLSDAAAQGDETALQLWREIGSYLGRGIAGMVLILNPDAVVLAGGVSRGAEYFLPSVKEVFERQSIKTPFKNLKVLLSDEGNIGGIGAALYALSKVNEK